MSKCSCGVVPGDCYDACGARESKISNLIRERDAFAGLLRESKNYATTLAVSMHKQHYVEAAPNGLPLPDLVGLLTQIDNMYAGVRNDLEAAEVENKRLVGLPLATLMAERDALREKANALLHQIDIGDYVDSEGHVLKNNIAVLTLMKALTNA